MTDLDRYLTEELARTARGIELPPADVDAVIARCCRRRRRQRVLTSLVLVVGLVAGVTGVERARRPPEDTAVAASTSVVRRGDTGIRWRRTDTSAGLGYARALTAGGALYAISTAPGQADLGSRDAPPPVLYRSANGVDWSPVAGGEGELFLADLSARGDRLYAVATGTATARTTSGRPVSDLLATWSDDGAETWNRVKLPVDVAALAATTTNSGVSGTKVAAGDHGVLVVATLRGELDLPSLLPAGVTAPNGWAVTDTGVEILGDGPECPEGSSPEPKGPNTMPGPATAPDGGLPRPGQVGTTFCFAEDARSPLAVDPQSTRGVTRTFTWSDLGIGGDVVAAVRGTPLAFLSSDGSTFERVELPLPQAAAFEVAADDAGFTLAATLAAPGGDHVQPVVLRSPDGRRWEPAPPPPGFVSTLGRLSDRIAVVRGDVAPTLSTLGADGWSTAALRDALDPAVLEDSSVSFIQAGIGPLGAAAVVGVVPDPVAAGGGVRVTDRGYTLHLLNAQWEAVVTDEGGNEVARVDTLMAGGGRGPLRLEPRTSVATLVDPATGAELARFDFQRKLEPASRGKEAAPMTAYVLFSRDGVTWSSEPLSKLAGRDVSMVSNVTVTATDVLISVPRPGPDPRKPGPVTVLRGTL
jgi:hypothetical protein